MRLTLTIASALIAVLSGQALHAGEAQDIVRAALDYWRCTAVVALVLSLSFAMLCLPFNPAALVWRNCHRLVPTGRLSAADSGYGE